MKNKEKNKSDVKQVLKKQVSTDEYNSQSCNSKY